jgi:hypothetical protein
MKLRTLVFAQLATLFLALSTSAFAAGDAYLYIIHSIPGRAVAESLNPGYPIDVFVNGKTCLIRGLTFSNTDGPYTLAAGTYELQISPSNTLAPCTNPAVIDTTITLAPGENVSAVATISAGAPTLMTFTNNLASIASGSARFVLANSADAPALEAVLTQLGVKDPKSFSVTANPGAQSGTTVPSGTYSVQIVASGTTTVLWQQNITLTDQSATFAYGAGSSANNTVELVTRAIRAVF